MLVHLSIKPLLFRSPSSPHTPSLHLKLHFKSIDNWQKKSKKEEFHRTQNTQKFFKILILSPLGKFGGYLLQLIEKERTHHLA